MVAQSHHIGDFKSFQSLSSFVIVWLFEDELNNWDYYDDGIKAVHVIYNIGLKSQTEYFHDHLTDENPGAYEIDGFQD